MAKRGKRGIVFNIGFKLTRVFFDSRRIKSSFENRARKIHGKFGAFVMKAARQSIKKASFVARKKRGQERTDFRTKSSPPGQAPYSQKGTLKHNIFFDYSSANVAIGPEKTPRKVADGRPVGGARTVPEVLEYGGKIEIIEYQRDFTPKGRQYVRDRWGHDPDAWHRLGKKRIYHKTGRPLRIRAKRKRILNIAARPFMGPAFEKEKPKLPEMWKNSVR